MNPSHPQVCDHFNTAITGGGWNKKEATAKGRPMGKAAQPWLKSIALFPFFQTKFFVQVMTEAVLGWVEYYAKYAWE